MVPWLKGTQISWCSHFIFRTTLLVHIQDGIITLDVANNQTKQKNQPFCLGWCLGVGVSRRLVGFESIDKLSNRENFGSAWQFSVLFFDFHCKLCTISFALASGNPTNCTCCRRVLLLPRPPFPFLSSCQGHCKLVRGCLPLSFLWYFIQPTQHHRFCPKKVSLYKFT